MDPVEVRDLDLIVEPTKLFLAEGDAGQLHARLVDGSGDAVPMSELQWRSSDSNVATVNDDGIVSALQNGTVVITATANGKKKDAEVGVRGKGKLEIHLSSGSGQEGPVDETLPLPLVVEVRDRTGAGVADVDVEWKATGGDGSLSASTTTTNQNGLTQALWTLGTVAGEQNVQAQVKGAGTVDFYGTAEPGPPTAVEVSPTSADLEVGSKKKFEASAKDQHGNPVTDASFTWASSAGDVAYVDTTGVATGMSAGSALVEAYAGSALGAGSVSVSGDETTDGTSVTASTESHIFTAIDQSLQLSATATDTSGATIEDAALTWSSTHTDIATVDDMGLVIAKAVGTASVIVSALCCQEADTVLIEVTQVAASVSVTPTELALDVGDSHILEATVLDSEGHPLEGAAVAWSSSDINVAAIDSAGVVTAQDTGSVTFEAVSGDASGAATGTVNEEEQPESDPVATSMEVSPSEFSLDVGLTQQLDAVVLDQNGDPMSDASVTWSSSDPAIATIDSQGLVTAVAAGSVTFQAMSGELVDGSGGTITEPATGGGGDIDSFFYDGFESGDMLANTGGFDWGSNNRTSVVRDDGCAVYNNKTIMNCDQEFSDTWENGPASSGSHALRFRYAAGEAMAEQRLSIGSAHRELWASWWLRVPVNFEHTSGNNKLFMFWMDAYSAGGDGSTVGMEFRPDGSGGSYFYAKVSSGRETVLGGDQGKHPFITYPSDQDRWMQIVVRMKAESSEDARDGIVEVWRRWEGESTYTQTHDLSGQPIRVPASGPDGFSAGYLMGWANGAYSVDTEFLLDDFRLSSTSLLEGG